MARSCSICIHDQRPEIERLLVTRTASYRNISEQFGVSIAAVSRHVNEGHIAERLAKAYQAEEAAEAERLLTNVRKLQAHTLRALFAAEDARDWNTMLKAVREARQNISLLAEMRGQLDRRPQVNVLVSPEWLRIKVAMVEALSPFPEASGAVATRLMELEEGGNGNG